MKYCRCFLLIVLLIVLFTSCTHIIDARIVGKDRSTLITKDGIPYKEFKFDGFDVIQYRISCGVTRTQNYCQLKEYFLKDGVIVRVMYRDEYYEYPMPK